MRFWSKAFFSAYILLLLFSVQTEVLAGNIDATDKYAEFLDATGPRINFGTTEGDVTVTDSAITGYAWSGSYGWINLAPSTSGVVNDGSGNLSGYAWGEGTGWVNFNPTNGGVTIDTSTGEFSGYAWSQNIGWVSFNCSDEGVCGSNDYKVKTSWSVSSTQCNDGIDNDGDGETDYPNDDGCDSASDDDETDTSGGGTSSGPPTDPDPEPEPEPTPDLEPTPEPDPEPVPDPDHEPSPETDPESEPSAEPDSSPSSDLGESPNSDDGSSPTKRHELSFLPDFIPTTEDIIKALPPVVSKVTIAAKKVVEDPVGQLTTKTISTVGVVTGSVGGVMTLFANPFTVGELFSLPFRLWSLLLSFIGLRKKYKPWGVVYDSFTKQPLDPVYVELTDLQGYEISTSITDIDGRYGFLMHPGSYKILANKTNYVFPSGNLLGRTDDELYANLYFGEEININEEDAVISKNIPMDPVDFDWNEFAKKDKRLMRFYSRFDIWFYRFTEVMFYLGFIVAVVVLFLVPAPYNLIIFGLYILMSIFRILGLKPRKNGHVTEKETGNPLSFALIRIFSPGIDQEISKRTTDAYGRYFALVPKGSYYVTVEKKNQDGTYTHITTSELLKAKNGIIFKDFSI